MGLFRKSPEERLLAEAVKFAGQQLRPSAQGGGGGVETRWRGASRVLRSMASWVPGLGSPRRDLNTPERATLVARSRDAMRNHLIARAAIVRNRTSVVGTGLICRPQVDWEALGIDEEEGERLNAQLEREWTLWAENPLECDAEATLNHYQLQALALVSALVGGDAFATTPDIERPGTLYSTRIQLIETDRVSNPHGMPDSTNLVNGVEFDAHGAPVAFHICTGYPGEPVAGQPLEWQRIPVFGAETGRRRVLQIWCDKDRPGQKRGAPYLAPVLEPLQKLERYSSAELMAAIISAMFTVFLKKGEAFEQGNLPLSALGDGMGGHDALDQPPVELGEGAVVDLAPGEEPVIANPARPNAQFDPFFTSIVKEIGAALELPMEELMLYYSSSYSAARAGMLQAWRAYQMRRWWLVCDFCQPSYELLIDEAVARGRIRAPGYSDPARRRAYTRAIWIGPARGAIDELKEANAAGKRIEIGVSNETIEAAAMTGETWQQIYRQRKRELDQRRRDGLSNAPPQPEEPPQPAEE
ncbi:phage portal protein [Azotobacter chroococcum]|uniref:Phage portal protein n=1 Tax=Azotobacter chroococcum TaxID=353 RepID=A0AAP9Y9W3_9GAMM|nr:phage portal protein [Azotobacter chroococcum]QQE87316.1 phage portal protein [Azotobacter chroococcum]